MGVKRRDHVRLGRRGVWKTWGTPGMKGTTQGGDAPASPLALHTVTPLSLRGPPAEPRAPHPLSIPCPFPSEIPGPTHRHSNLAAPHPAPSRRQALFPCGPVPNCCCPLLQQPRRATHPSKAHDDWGRQASVATASQCYLLGKNLVFRNSLDYVCTQKPLP